MLFVFVYNNQHQVKFSELGSDKWVKCRFVRHLNPITSLIPGVIFLMIRVKRFSTVIVIGVENVSFSGTLKQLHYFLVKKKHFQ